MDFNEMERLEGSLDRIIRKNRRIEIIKRWFKKHHIIRRSIKYLIVIFVIWLLYINFRVPIISFIESNYVLNTIFQHIKHQIQFKTYLGLFYASILGAQVFFSMPVELISLVYFQGGYNPFLVIIICVSGILLSLMFNYLIGLIFGKNILKYFLKKHYEGVERKIHKYGGWIIFGLSLIVSPVDLFVLVCGSMKYPFKKMIKIVVLAQSIKFTGLYLAVGYFTRFVMPFIKGLF